MKITGFLHLNLVIDMCFVIIIEDYFDFCCSRAMTQQWFLHLAVNWEVFTINVDYRRGKAVLACGGESVGW